jgi:hypothetical protein
MLAGRAAPSKRRASATGPNVFAVHIVVPLSNQVTTLNHKRFKGFKMFSDGH